MVTLAVLLILLALLLGGFGLAVKGLFWLFVIAVAIFVIGALTGLGSRR